MMPRLIGKLFPLLLLMAVMPAYGSLVASVDRTIISDQDSIILTVRASDEAFNTKPDFSAIEADFEIISNSSRSNSSFTIINGKTSAVSYKDHELILRPKRIGTLMIPPIPAGNVFSQPISILVQQRTPAQRAQMDRFVFFETDVDTTETYVQEQVLYAVKLFYTGDVSGDFSQALVLPDAVVETLETEKRYESIHKGRRYYVLEKRYAIFPQRSGVLTIPRARFRGTLGRGGNFSARQTVHAMSDAPTINVKTIPESFSGDTWIPTRALDVTASWSEAPPTFRVGEPVNRKLTISATGLPASLLPLMEAMTIENAKVYADPPVTENRVGTDGITALQVTTFGIVPTREGRITLPEIRILWWNTQTDREEAAVIPAASYPVLPPLVDSVTTLGGAAPIGYPGGEIIREAIPPYWQWAAIALALLWLFSTWRWFSAGRQLSALTSAHNNHQDMVVFDDPDEAREYKALKDACASNQPEVAHRQLFLWARANSPGITSIADLVKLHPDLAAEINDLEARLYSKEASTDWRGARLVELLNGLRSGGEKPHRRRSLQASLNPA